MGVGVGVQRGKGGSANWIHYRVKGLWRRRVDEAALDRGRRHESGVAVGHRPGFNQLATTSGKTIDATVAST